MSAPSPAESAEVLIQVHGSALGAHPGAEISGVVIEAGRAAQELLGQPVVVPRLLPCGVCNLCQRSRIASCPHLHARGGPPRSQERVPARFVLPLGPPLFQTAVETEGLWQYAALSDALAAPHAGLLRAGLHTGELCAIIAGPGSGFRAAAAALVLKALGCPAVVLSSDAAGRERLMAPPFGARAALDSGALDDEAARALLRAEAAAAGLPDHGLCLLEVTGTDAGRARALGLVERGGTAVLLDRMDSAQAPRATLAAPLAAGPQIGGIAALDRLCGEQGAVIGAGAPHPDLLPELFTLLRRASISLDALVTAITPDSIDLALLQRRQGLADPVTLPVVRFI